MKPQYKHILPGIVLLLLLSYGCDKQEPFPLFLELKTPKIALNESGSQTTDLGIKDLWIEHNASNLGVFRTPRVVPLLQDPAGDILAIFGGVFQNGFSAFRTRYPFWKPQFVDLPALTPPDTFPIDLTFEYFPDSVLVFPLVENFENASFGFDNQTTSEKATTLSTTTADYFQGGAAGKVNFSPEQNSFEVISSDAFFLPQSGSNDIYIEIAYKNDVSFTAGLYYITQGLNAGEISPGVFFNTNMEGWNIAYLHINDQVREAPRNAVFRLYIKANSGTASGTLLLDNIRIVHFR
jgi:hypothetical protein